MHGRGVTEFQRPEKHGAEACLVQFQKEPVGNTLALQGHTHFLLQPLNSAMLATK